MELIRDIKGSHDRWSRLTRGAARRRRPWMAAVVATVSALSVAPVAGAPASAASSGVGGKPVGAVYVASNAYGGNSILTFPRYADGSLGAASAAVATGGRGSGPGQYAPIVNDPLGSQNSLIVDQSGQFLFAVNAGSNTVSSFTVSPGGLNLVDQEPSGGAFPVSLADFGHTLYVLNAVGNSVTGFTVNGAGHLNAFQTCQLPGLPAGTQLSAFPATTLSSAQPVDTQTAGQVGFSPNGKWLVVTSKQGPVSTTTPPGGPGDEFPFGGTSGPGQIYAYPVNSNGTVNCSSPGITTLQPNPDGQGEFPFSFAWSSQGNLLVTEVFGESDLPANFPTGLSAVSSFTLNANGTFSLQGKAADYGPVPCWIVRSGNKVFVANFLGPDFAQAGISGYQIAPGGALTPAGGAATPLPGGTNPIDMAISPGGQFLYELAPGSGTAQVFPFAVGSTGNLTALTPVNDGLGANSGQAGIATVTFAGPPANANCANETLSPGAYQNVTAGAGCTINSSDYIEGNVQVQNGGSLWDQGASIGGNLQASNAVWIAVGYGGSIGGNLQVTGLTSEPGNLASGNPDGFNYLCNTQVGGDVQVQNNGVHAPFDIGSAPDCSTGLTIGGNMQVHNNAAEVIVGSSTPANSVRGNIAVSNNTGGGSLTGNVAGGTCQLANDSPPIAGGGNSTPIGDQNTCNSSA